MSDKKMIRFIDSNYNDLFLIPDGANIVLTLPSGERKTRSCKFLDSTHVQIGNEVLHIHQFAEGIERSGTKCVPEIPPELPDRCHTILPSSGELILIEKGAKEHIPCPWCHPSQAQKEAARMNAPTRVTRQQEAAMRGGLLYGWSTDAAKTTSYDFEGNPVDPSVQKMISEQRSPEMDKAPDKPGPPSVYMASMEDARQNGETKAWRESLRLNEASAKGIQAAINDSHNGQYSYDLSAALKAVTAEYGKERVHVVLANTVDYKDYDGRFSRENRQWAQGIQLPQLTRERRADFVCEAHPAILDGFINTVRKQQQEKRPSVTDSLRAPSKSASAQKTDKPVTKKRGDKHAGEPSSL